MAREPRKPGHANVGNAMTTAIRDLRNLRKPGIDLLPDDIRIDGRTCLVTGARLWEASEASVARAGESA